MKVYETTFILSPQADDATFDRQIKSVTDLIDRNKGKMLHEDRWGIRRMAYPIQKFNQGFYTRLVFEGNNEVLTEMERFFRLEETFIRHLTVIFEGDLNAPKPELFFDKRSDRNHDSRDDRKPVVEEKPVMEKKEEAAPVKEAPAEAAAPAEKPTDDRPADEKQEDDKPTEN